MFDTPCASVVIPCLNEVNHIGPCLASLRAQEGLIGQGSLGCGWGQYL